MALYGQDCAASKIVWLLAPFLSNTSSGAYAMNEDFKLASSILNTCGAIATQLPTPMHASFSIFTSIFILFIPLIFEKLPNPLDLITGIATNITPLTNHIPSVRNTPALVNAKPIENIAKSIINCCIFFSIIY